MKRVIRDRNSTCSSFQMPMSAGEIRPRGSTAVASMQTSEAPPEARLPRCTKCQSLANPSTEGIHAHRRHRNPVAEGNFA
jgi:hypothetical protein